VAAIDMHWLTMHCSHAGGWSLPASCPSFIALNGASLIGLSLLGLPSTHCYPS